MYKALFFDVDDTLLNFDMCSKIALSETFHSLQLDFSDGIYEYFQECGRILWQKQKQGLLSVPEVMTQKFQLLARKLGIEGKDQLLKTQFEEQLGNTGILVPHAKETVQELSKEYRLFAASNGFQKMQINRLEKAHILHYFEDVYVSDDIGYEKPDIKFFDECLKRCQMERDKILFIGDSIEADMSGAKNAGICTCWYNPKDCLDSVGVIHTIKDLSELRRKLL